MNKITDALWQTYDTVIPTTTEWIERISCRISSLVRRQPYRQKLAPRWQQLELPLSNTPVQRWHR